MTTNLSFLPALLLATSANRSAAIPLKKRDKKAVRVHADNTERAIGVALYGLGQIVSKLAKFQSGSDFVHLAKLLNLAGKLEVLLVKVRDLSLQFGGGEEEIGDGVLQLRVMEFLRDVADLFDPVDNRACACQDVHTRSHDAVELLKFMDTAKRPYPPELPGLALTMLESDLGIVGSPIIEDTEPATGGQ